MNIILVNKANTSNRPPIISVLFILADLGLNVKLITCKVSSGFKQILTEKKIEVFELPYFSKKSFFGKIIEYFKFRHYAFKLIKDHYNDNSLLWIADAQSIVALGNKLKHYKKL